MLPCPKFSSEKPQKPNLVQVIISTLAGAIGVQSSRNRERDFSGNNIWTYVLSGLVLASLFIGGLVFWVQHLLATQ